MEVLTERRESDALSTYKALEATRSVAVELSGSAPERSSGSPHGSQGGGIIGGDEEQDVPGPDDMGCRHPIDHDRAALRLHLTIGSNHGLRSRAFGIGWEQEDLD